VSAALRGAPPAGATLLTAALFAAPDRPDRAIRGQPAPIRGRRRGPSNAEVAAALAAFFATGGRVQRFPAAFAAPMQGIRIDPEAQAIAARALAAASRSAPAFSPAEATCLAILRQMAGLDGAMVPVEAWREACQAPDSGITPAGKPGSRRQVANRAIRGLHAKGAVATADGMTREAGRSALSS
jgi:hypothetical protein